MNNHERVNIINGFINPYILSRVKSKIGLYKTLDSKEIIQAVNNILDKEFMPAAGIIQDDGCIVAQSILKSRNYLLSQQKPDGHWIGELEANTTLTAEYIMLMYFMGMVDQTKLKKAANYIRSKQLQDGSWPIYYGGPGDISASVESYFALKLAGYDKDEPFMCKARDFILKSGGIMKSRVITKINLSFFGQFDWMGTPSIPVEIIFIPRVCSFNIYEFSSWARICVVPLTILMELKPRIKISESANIDELYTLKRNEVDFSFEKDDNFLSWHNFFVGVDKILKLLEKSPVKISKRLAIKKAEKWILDHQDKSGDWGGIFPAMAFSVMALKTIGYDNDFKPIRKGLEAIERFHIEDENHIHQQSCVSPVWDTAWASIALFESGLKDNDKNLQKAAFWLYGKQTTQYGDWKIKVPHAQPGGWSFEYYNEFYPDADDTSAVIMALLNINGVDGINKTDRIKKGLTWLLNMQNTDGGWGAFDKDVNNPVYNRILFNDFKTMLDPSCPDITGRVIELLAILGYDKNFLPVKLAIDYLKREQHPSGPWFGRWGVNFIYGTWAVLAGLAAIGESKDQPYVRRAIDWLFALQNPDGGWGESCRSYEAEKFAGRGTSTPSQTAWALIGLVSYGYANDSRVEKGIKFLIDRQLQDGSWEEKEFTGTGFPRSFYIRYHMYKDFFPLIALSKYKKEVARNNN